MSDQRTGSGGAITDRVTGKLKKAAGAVLGDERLSAEGELHEQRADAKTEAARADERAEQADAEADLEAREAALVTEEQELAVQAHAVERDARLDREEQEQKARLVHEEAERQVAAERNARAATAAVGRDEVSADMDRLAAEAETTTLEDRADAARARAEMLQQAEDATGGEQR